MQASIITIGDEILIGQIIDTNSAWLAQQLNNIGVSVHEIRSVADKKEQMVGAINELFKFSDFVFITGGLGPTNDDITKKVLCEMFQCDLVLSESALQNVHELLGRRGISINEHNYNQAMVPAKAEVFINKLGTAPGMMFKGCKKLLFSMPGVPFEMKYLCENEFLPYIKKNYKLSQIFHKTILTSGLPEAILAEKLSNWENSLPKEMNLAFLPTPGFVRLRLSIYDANKESIEVLEKKVNELKQIIPDNFKTADDQKPEELLGVLLKEKNQTVSTAESCTGGKIAAMLTSKPGSSAYFNGSVVAYCNDVKMNVLAVESKVLEEHGAVSSQVVEQMAEGVKELLKTDYSISVSGIAGPDGGTDEKPVGTVWIGVATPDRIISKKYLFYNDREININRSANAGIMMLINEILK